MEKNNRFGYSWIIFTFAFAVHVFDEATHDFLSFYNSTAEAIRSRLPFLPLPTFTFRTWLGGLIAGLVLLLCISPLAFRRVRWLRVIAIPLGIVVGVFNASLHIFGSIYYGRWMPGVYSSPLLLIAASYLLATSIITTKQFVTPNQQRHRAPDKSPE
jgi:hypothetical protein